MERLIKYGCSQCGKEVGIPEQPTAKGFKNLKILRLVICALCFDESMKGFAQKQFIKE